MFGAQATSRTQSVWPSRISSSTHEWESWRYLQIFTRLSQPALAKRLTEAVCWLSAFVCWGVMREPGNIAGAQETALHPIAWPLKISASHWPSSAWCINDGVHRLGLKGDWLLKVNTEIFPSEEAQLRIAPSSWGAQETELTAIYRKKKVFIT